MNPHGRLSPRDFKSLVSANSTIRASILRNYALFTSKATNCLTLRALYEPSVNVTKIIVLKIFIRHSETTDPKSLLPARISEALTFLIILKWNLKIAQRSHGSHSSDQKSFVTGCMSQTLYFCLAFLWRHFFQTKSFCFFLSSTYTGLTFFLCGFLKGLLLYCDSPSFLKGTAYLGLSHILPLVNKE